MGQKPKPITCSMADDGTCFFAAHKANVTEVSARRKDLAEIEETFATCVDDNSIGNAFVVCVHSDSRARCRLGKIQGGNSLGCNSCAVHRFRWAFHTTREIPQEIDHWRTDGMAMGMPNACSI